MNPSILFSTESNYLENVSGVALKGSIEYEDRGRREAADFKAIFSGRDSIYFQVEGPFNADLLCLIVTGDSAFAKSREMDSWQAMLSAEPADLSEYSPEGLAPIDLGSYILPQYFLKLSGNSGRNLKLSSFYGYSEFLAAPAADNRSFLLERLSSPIKASYSKGKRFQNGAFPSNIEISHQTENWRLKMKITDLRVNPKITPKIWQITQ